MEIPRAFRSGKCATIVLDSILIIPRVPQCGNLQIFPHDFLQKFRQINFFTKLKSYTVNQFDEKCLKWGGGKFPKLTHCGVEI